ncbi:unnamed protein product [Protopolystoma xenopodis]|uniref:Ig-like domain-containing protein n=1 Tax=Protopolystoma xenopodis TaxID=117903 RepID=A0A3S5AVJ0_9PLAT|nr:unnamed protein product [Protopolystoma xenopodis]
MRTNETRCTAAGWIKTIQAHYEIEWDVYKPIDPRIVVFNASHVSSQEYAALKEDVHSELANLSFRQSLLIPQVDTATSSSPIGLPETHALPTPLPLEPYTLMEGRPALLRCYFRYIEEAHDSRPPAQIVYWLRNGAPLPSPPFHVSNMRQRNEGISALWVNAYSVERPSSLKDQAKWARRGCSKSNRSSESKASANPRPIPGLGPDSTGSLSPNQTFSRSPSNFYDVPGRSGELLADFEPRQSVRGPGGVDVANAAVGLETGFGGGSATTAQVGVGEDASFRGDQGEYDRSLGEENENCAPERGYGMMKDKQKGSYYNEERGFPMASITCVVESRVRRDPDYIVETNKT